MKINAVLLAAGDSTRFEKNKLLSEFHGRKIAEYAFDAAEECGFNKVIAVTQYDEIEKMAEERGYSCVRNDMPELGLSHSVMLGTKQCLDADGVVFLVCDQPFIAEGTLERILKQADDTHILRCSFGEKKGNPAYFPSCYFEELMSIQGDVGGKAVIKNHPESVKEIRAGSAMELADIDRQSDLDKYI